MIFEINVDLDRVDATYLAPTIAFSRFVIARLPGFLKNSFIIRNGQPNVRAPWIRSEPNLAKKGFRTLANKERNQTKSREVGEEPRSTQACCGVFNAGAAQPFVQFQQQFFATARRDMALKDIVSKELVFGTPRVEKETWTVCAHRFEPPVGLIMHTTDQTFIFKSAYNTTCKPRVRVRTFSELSNSRSLVKSLNRPGAPPISKKHTGDTRTLRRKYVGRSSSGFEEVRATLHMYQ
jgi:hypothetical protein